MITIRVEELDTAAIRRIDGMVKALTHRRSLHALMGKDAEVTLRRHFLELNSRPNKRGWPKSNFWAEVRRRTVLVSADDESAQVAIASRPFLLQLHGGTVRPKEKELLAIPLRPEAKGIWPRSGLISGLFLLKSKGRLFLAKREEGVISLMARRNSESSPKRTRSAGALTIYFKLVRSVYVPAYPGAMPEEALRAAMRRRAASWIGKLVGTSAAPEGGAA